MKLSIVIFNYNYKRFLGQLFISLEYAFNNDNINIFFCDDGSSDDSLGFVNSYIHTNNINNLTIIEVSPIELKRKYPSFGQLEGIKKVIDSYNKELNDYIVFIDSDDWFGENSIKNIYNEVNKTKCKIYFNDLRDAESYHKLPKEKQMIKRKVHQINTKIWPTIVPTSGIVINKQLLIDNLDKIINFDKKFSDVWLDSRINMLALNFIEKVKYTDIVIYRLIHGSNDSLQFNLKRTIKKQLQASKYFNLIVNKKLKFNIRKKILEIIHG